MSGFEIAQYLRENYENGIYDFLPPMIAFTANVMQSEQEYLEMGMDGVLRKPISIKDLHHCLQQFFADESESIIEMNDDNELSEQFDLALIETLGKKQILENLSLFKQTMPNYLAQLSKDNMKETEDTAHKIKGAAASVGLNHLRQLADTLESAAKNSDVFLLCLKFTSKTTSSQFLIDGRLCFFLASFLITKPIPNVVVSRVIILNITFVWHINRLYFSKSFVC